MGTGELIAHEEVSDVVAGLFPGFSLLNSVGLQQFTFDGSKL